MRLLNTKTYRLEEFVTNIPKYAILSHTWGDDEVTFQNILDLKVAVKKAGWPKVQKACKYVRQFKFDWIWIDTCCIDKSSSAELSEALNSMYKYYGEGHVCIAYLNDVLIENNVSDLEELKESRWFKRGWTLQELIAPRYMVFLDKNWNTIGTRSGMRHIVSQATSIPVEVFEGGELDTYSVAQKMSWAAFRETTREEDMAYCLMGLFGVNMPPIYGEGGAKAFMRLQQEIIKYSDDRSIFAWVTSQDYHRDRGMFASSPSEFASSGEVGISDSVGLGDKSSFSFGNNGLRIYLPLQQRPDIGKDIFVISLHCRDAKGVIGIYVQKKEHRYIRWCPHFPLSHPNTLLGDLQEVVVEEAAILRQVKLLDYDVPVEFKLDSDITLLGEYDNIFLPRDWDRTLGLRTKNGNRFELRLQGYWHPKDIVPAVKVQLRIYKYVVDVDCHFLEDSGLLPIRSQDVLDALVACFIHTTGDSKNRRRVVEINHIPSSSTKFGFYRQILEFRCTPRTLGLTTLGFMIDDSVSSESSFLSSLLLASIFPPNLCQRQGGKAYGSISYLGEQCNMHCVFQYIKLPMTSRSINHVFIVLGLRADSGCCIPWVDIFVPDDDRLSISDVWTSYLSSGSRYKLRRDNTITLAIGPRSRNSLAVTVEKEIVDSFYHAVLTLDR